MDYVTQVLNAYTDYRAHTVIKSTKEGQRIQDEQNDRDRQDRLQSSIEMMATINMDYNLWRNDNGVDIKADAIKYDWLVEKGYMAEPDHNEKRACREQALVLRRQKLMDSRAMGNESYRTIKAIIEEHDSETFSAMETGIVRGIAKGIYLRKWFATLSDFPAHVAQ